jgi:4-deoxy-L-threo-5-hexosulose-uronate ketol-isomerase
MSIHYQERFATNPQDFKSYDTERIRKDFLLDNLFEKESINLVYSHYDRYIVGGAVPIEKKLGLETIDPLKADYFLERREMGVINIGGNGKIEVDGTTFELDYKEALYIGRGSKEVIFSSESKDKPANFYINSAPAHKEYPTTKVTLADAEVVELGALETSNARKINKMIVNSVVRTCQLQMGMTELRTGSIWNTMPPHTHTRRMEAYLYFEVPDDQVVCHFMGRPDETRHLWLKNKQAVLSPAWSIHSGAGTSNYIFIWGMAGENLDYTDMDVAAPTELR